MILTLYAFSEWKYMTHGGRHVVFYYTGERTYFKSSVLRFRYQDEFSNTDEHIEAVQLESELYDHVVDKYFGSSYKVDYFIVELSHEFICYCTSEFHKINHLARTKLSRHAWMCDNLKAADYISYEIKPKWLGCGSNVFNHNKSKCPYCSHRKRASDNSDYCPSYLFSGDALYIEKALKNYFKDLDIQPNVVNSLIQIFLHDKAIHTLKRIFLKNCKLAHRICKSQHSRLTCNEFFEQYRAHISLKSTNDLFDFITTFSIKDCSLFIFPNHDISEGKIKIIDIDLKNIENLEKYLMCTIKCCCDPLHQYVC